METNSQRNRILVVDARTMNEGDGWTGSGSNPWHLGKNTESVLFLTDEGAAPARIGLSITAGGVHYYLTELSLAPGETRAIDIRKLRDAGIADFKGHMIPANAADGSVDWIRLDNVSVAGRLLVIRRGQGVASSFDCYTCPCPANYSLDGVDVSPTSFDFLPGDIYDLSASGYWVNCNGDGYYSDVTGQCSWWSNDTSIATTSGYEVTAVAGGSTTIGCSFTGTVYQVNASDNECSAQSFPEQGSSTANVMVPYFLKVVSSQTTSPECPSGSTTCMLSLTYQVLDANQAPIELQGMLIQESVTGGETQGGCTGTIQDSSQWYTDPTGTMTSSDNWWWCCDTGCNGAFSFSQTFTVDANPVQILNGSYAGSHNVVAIQCKNGVPTCPSVVPTP